MAKTVSKAMKITREIRNAIIRAVEEAGSQSALDRISGVSQRNLSRYVSGIDSMSERTWRDLYPHIKQYLPADYPVPEPARPVRQEARVPDTPMVKVPVIGFAAAATVNPALMPIAEFAAEHPEDYQAFPLAKKGDFCLVVSGDSMLPWYPEGTRLLCRPCRPRKGQRVVAVLGTGEVVFKVFADKDDKFCLFSINDEGGGQDFVFDKNDFSAVRAIYSIIESIRDESAIDQAMKSSGIHHRWEEKLKNV